MSFQKPPLLIDTGSIVALFHNADMYHTQARLIFQKLHSQYEFTTTVFVFHEICWLIKKKCGHEILVAFLKLMDDQPIFKIQELQPNWISLSTKIIEKFSDHNFDMADISLVILADIVQCGEILTVDRKDFSILRWGPNAKSSFQNLFFD
ncbi:MAG: PIN domain-containing protein [Chlamydiia bacterium]|nr:PIN domain-containing protein [Chlamydiia bacterium]